jgi:hypothetical protein
MKLQNQNFKEMYFIVYKIKPQGIGTAGGYCKIPKKGLRKCSYFVAC